MEGTGSRLELEVQWRSRLTAAEAHYRFAATQFDKLVTEQRARTLPVPDGSYAIRRAMEIQSEALAEYMRVLGIFTELIVSNKIPQDS
jgi:hypothetical protein